MMNWISEHRLLLEVLILVLNLILAGVVIYNTRRIGIILQRIQWFEQMVKPKKGAGGPRGERRRAEDHELRYIQRIPGPTSDPDDEQWTIERKGGEDAG